MERQLFPLATPEIPRADLLRILRHGALPPHYLAGEPRPLLKAYVNTYLKEEIIDESVTRNVPAFARFLEVVALTHGQQLNYTNIARETGVCANTVRNYFVLLEDTLLGFTLEPWRRRRRRRLVGTPKFYLFDVGVANQLHPEAKTIAEGTDLFGRAYEHFLINEVRAFLAYRDRDLRPTYWRTSSGFEVDLIVGDLELALEFKSTQKVRTADFRGLRALAQEHTVRRRMVVAREEEPRTTDDGIEIMPWRTFCRGLWGGDLL